MKLSLLASVAAVALGTGTASAQYPAYVPPGNHYHAVPSFPAYGGGGFSLYAADRTGAFGLSVGRPYVPSYGYGGGYGGYGGYNHGYNHNHHHHGYGWNR